MIRETTRKVETIGETCGKCGTALQYYRPIDRRWCPVCVGVDKERKREEREKKINEMTRHYQSVELRKMIGDVVVDFDLGSYRYHPRPRVSGTAEKLFHPDRKLWGKNIKLFFTGGGGTGKTLTASLACREAARVGLSVKFLSLGDLRELYRPGTEGLAKTLLEMKVVQVLVIDDVEYGKYNENLYNDLKNIFDHRLRMKATLTILTSNRPLDPGQLVNFEERRLGEFRKGVIDFGRLPYPYTTDRPLSETGQRILGYLKDNPSSPKTYLDIEVGARISTPQQYRDQLLGAGVRMVSVERGGRKLKAFVWEKN